MEQKAITVKGNRLLLIWLENFLFKSKIKNVEEGVKERPTNLKIKGIIKYENNKWVHVQKERRQIEHGTLIMKAA